MEWSNPKNSAILRLAAQRPKPRRSGRRSHRPRISFEEPLRGYVEQRGRGSDRAPRQVLIDTAGERLACPVCVEDLEGYGNGMSIAVDAAKNPRRSGHTQRVVARCPAAGCPRVLVACPRSPPARVAWCRQESSNGFNDVTPEG